MSTPSIEVEVSVEVGPDDDEGCGCCGMCPDVPCAADCSCGCDGADTGGSAMATTKSRGIESVTTAEAAQRRAAAMSELSPGEARRSRPNDERARAVPFPAKLRSRMVDREGKQFHELLGYASTVDQPYEMWDMFGPYTENVDGMAFDRTLAAGPDVAFLLNHRGMTMARTVNKTLELSVDALGLRSQAILNPERSDVRDLISAVNDRLITEMSFAFMITDAEWNEDYTEFNIREVDLDRGDVSAVNYGANPYTSIAARTREFFQDIDHLPLGAARAAITLLTNRTNVAPVTAPAPEPEPISAPVEVQADTASNLDVGSVARYKAMLADD